MHIAEWQHLTIVCKQMFMHNFAATFTSSREKQVYHFQTNFVHSVREYVSPGEGNLFGVCRKANAIPDVVGSTPSSDPYLFCQKMD